MAENSRYFVVDAMICETGGLWFLHSSLNRNYASTSGYTG